MLHIAAAACILAGTASAQGKDARPLKGKVTFALKSLDMPAFSARLPADFVDQLDVRVTNEGADEAGTENNKGYRRWVWGVVLAQESRFPESELAVGLKHCSGMLSSLPVLKARRVSSAGVEGTQAVCGDARQAMPLVLSAMLNDKKADRHISVLLYFTDLRYSAKAQAFMDSIVDSVRSHAPAKAASPARPAEGAAVPLLR